MNTENKRLGPWKSLGPIYDELGDLQTQIDDLGGLEGIDVKVLWFEQINSGTSGSFSAPTGGTIELDQWGGGVDVLVSEISAGIPTFESVVDSDGVTVSGTLDVAGNWTISGSPTGYPIALIYVYSVDLVDLDSTKALEPAQVAGPGALKYMGEVSSEWTGLPQSAIDGTTIAFDDGTLTFSITPTGSQFSVWVQGIEFAYNAQQTAVITDTEGLWAFYVDTDGVFKVTQTIDADLIRNKALVSIVYWDATNDTAIIFADERHGLTMDGATHVYLHTSLGAQYVSGYQADDITSDGNGSLDASATLSITDGVINDEDITLSSSGSGQSLGSPAQIPVFYQDVTAGVWRKDAAGDFPVKNATTGNLRLAYNLIAAGAASQVEVGNNNFVLAHIFASNDSSEPVIAIQGQAEYVNINDARAGSLVELRDLFVSGLPAAEFVPLYSLIYQTSTSYSNGCKGRIRTTDLGDDYIDWRQQDVVGGGGSGTGNVSGPGSSTDNTIVRFDGTSGQLIQNSGVVIDDTNNMVFPTDASIQNSNNEDNITFGTTKLTLIGGNSGEKIELDETANGVYIYANDASLGEFYDDGVGTRGVWFGDIGTYNNFFGFTQGGALDYYIAGTGHLRITSNIATLGVSSDTSVELNQTNDTIDLETANVRRVRLSTSGFELASGSSAVTTILDEDDMSSDSATALATQQSIKAYVDSEVGSVPTDIIQEGDSKVEVVDTGTGQIVLNTDTVNRLTITATAAQFSTGVDVTIAGDLTVNGTTTTVNTDELDVADNLITVNAGEVGAGVTAGSAGLQVDRGSLTDYQILFDESDDRFKIGEIGSLQMVATREDTPTDTQIAYWNAAQNRFDTAGSLAYTALVDNTHDHNGGDGAQIDHVNLANKGTNTHSQIDTHIGDATIHFTVASIDHGSIDGLGDDDHSAYPLVTDFEVDRATIGTNWTDLTDGGDTTLHDHDGISENTAARHNRLHSMTGVLDHTATAWRVFYSGVSGTPVELALGAANTYLRSAGPAAAPTFQQIDHTTLSNIGSNSHATIDSHISATAAHGATGAVVGTTNTQTLSGKTLTSPTLNTTITLGNAAQINLTDTLSANLTGTGMVVTETVDVNAFGIGAALYKAADGNWETADASAAATAPCTALALASGTGSLKILLQGFLRRDAWNWTPGQILYLSETTGDITATAPTTSGAQVQVVGIAWTADIIYFNPSLVLVENA